MMNDKTLTFTYKGEYYRLAVISGALIFSRFDGGLNLWVQADDVFASELCEAALLALLR